MLRVHVTDTLASALETEKLALSITSIPVGLTGRPDKGTVQHRLKLNGSTLMADTSAVLSEGEHRAVALAAFLAELIMFPGNDPIIVDDPVSSLDHVRRSKVAERLIGEAKKRQVIVFTHDLAFLSDLRYQAAEQQVPIEVSAVRRAAQGYGSRDPDGDPWTTKQLGARKHWLGEQLVKLKKLHSEASPDYEAQAIFFYNRLRESWERLIEEKIFAQVVMRFQPQVQTLRLKEAVIDDEIVSQVHFGMSSASIYTGHDRPIAKGAAPPDPAQAEKDLNAFSTCLDQIQEKSKAVVTTRESKLKPPIPNQKKAEILK